MNRYYEYYKPTTLSAMISDISHYLADQYDGVPA